MTSYNVLRGRCFDIIAQNMQALTENKSDDIKDTFLLRNMYLINSLNFYMIMLLDFSKK